MVDFFVVQNLPIHTYGWGWFFRFVLYFFLIWVFQSHSGHFSGLILWKCVSIELMILKLSFPAWAVIYWNNYNSLMSIECFLSLRSLVCFTLSVNMDIYSAYLFYPVILCVFFIYCTWMLKYTKKVFWEQRSFWGEGIAFKFCLTFIRIVELSSSFLRTFISIYFIYFSSFSYKIAH